MKLSKIFRILFSSSEAVQHWWAQRLTAVALAPLSLWFIYSVTTMHGASYETVTSWLGNVTNSVLMLLFILILYYHAVLGLQVVIEDYIATEWRKKVLLISIKTPASLFALSAVISMIIIYVEF